MDDNALVFAMNGAETLIGRYDPVTELRPDIDLTDVDLKRTVSRGHARIIRTEEGHVVVEEMGALHGTFVNGIQLTAGQSYPIRDGDELGLGLVKMVFHT